MPPININELFLHVPRDWRWLWPGPWTFRFSGGFVIAYRLCALGLVLGVSFGGGFVLSYRWAALGLVLGAMVGGGFALSYRSR